MSRTRLRLPHLSFSVCPASPTTGHGSSQGRAAPGDSRGLETATAGSVRPAALTGPNAPWAPRGQASGRVAGGAEPELTRPLGTWGEAGGPPGSHAGAGRPRSDARGLRPVSSGTFAVLFALNVASPSHSRDAASPVSICLSLDFSFESSHC